jgi:hypothetical protein
VKILEKCEIFCSIKFCRAYAAFIVSRWAKLVAAILLCIAYALSVLGIDRMEATFEPQKTFPADSALQTSIGVINRVMTEVRNGNMNIFNFIFDIEYLIQIWAHLILI